MVLAEVLMEMNNLKKKISQLMLLMDNAAIHDSTATDKATSKLLGLLDKYRSHLILVNKINNYSEVTVGGSKLSLANAIIILRTIASKMSILNGLINKEDSILDVLSLVDQYDVLLEEHTTISKEIKAQEWGIEIDKESMG